jgi:Spy/CpxP family protein refolding chaperone
MKGKNLIITPAMAALITVAGIGFAGAMGGGMGGSMGGGYGMMGGQGQGMMGYGSNFSTPWGAQPTNPNYQNQQKETEGLRAEIRAKRQELSDLYRAEKPDKAMINQKIEELSKLEAELDQRIAGRY